MENAVLQNRVHTRSCVNEACPFHTYCIWIRLSRNFHSKDFTLSLLGGWSMTTLPKSKQKLEKDDKMFVFSQLTVPTPSPGRPPSVKLTCFVALWQTLAGIPYPLGPPLLNQSSPTFLFPTSHFWREAYWFSPWNDTVLFSGVGNVSASDEQGDLGQSRVKLVLNHFVQSKSKTNTYIDFLCTWYVLVDGTKRWMRCLSFIQRALSLVVKAGMETNQFHNKMQQLG